MMRNQNSDAGFTLAELIVYMVVLVILMTLAGGIFLNIITHERYARATAQANNTAQTLFKAAEYDLRNAKTAKTMWDGSVLLLSTRQAITGDLDEGVCVAYFFDATTDQVRRDTSVSSTTTTAVKNASTIAEIRALSANWAVYGDDTAPIVSGASGLPVFAPTNAVITSPNPVTVSLRFQTFNNRKPIEFAKSISLRPQPDLTKTCF